MKRIILELVIVASLFSCTKDKPKAAPSLTVGADNYSAISVVLKGKAKLEPPIASDLTVGFQYSKSAGILPSNSISVEAAEVTADYNYSTCITGLTPATTYYYRSYIRQNGQDAYGETMSFMTKDVSSLIKTLSASDIKATSATINARLDLTDVKYSNIDFGFYWGATDNDQNNKIKCERVENGAFSMSILELSHNTQYWFYPYVKLDNQELVGTVESFSTGSVPVERVVLDKDQVSLFSIGDTLTLKATVFPADATNKEIQWFSSNSLIATIDQHGMVRATDNGEAFITVMSRDQEKKDTCFITVAQRVLSISLNKTTLNLNEKETHSLVATVSPNNSANKEIRWQSSNNSIATVDSTGKVTAVSKGSTTIWAFATDGSEKRTSCSVNVSRLVSSLTFDKEEITIHNGESSSINAIILPSDASNMSLEWSSSNPVVATVSSNGLVRGVSRGVATITAKTKDGSEIQSSCTAEVKQYVTKIVLNQTNISLIVGEQSSISVSSTSPSNANDNTYTWSSSNDTIVTIDSFGQVTAVNAGKTTIIATANDGSGIKASCTVTVRNSIPPVGSVDLGLSVYWASYNIGASKIGDTGGYYAWGELATKSEYSWGTYKFSNRYEGPFSKYNSKSDYGPVDGKTILDPEDDIAHVLLGDNWRIPTEEEWSELIERCTWTNTSRVNSSGLSMSGYLVTGPNGNSIFIPRAGYKHNKQFLDNYKSCHYWSSSLGEASTSSAKCMKEDPAAYFWCGGAIRHAGLTIRPVTE